AYHSIESARRPSRGTNSTAVCPRATSPRKASKQGVNLIRKLACVHCFRIPTRHRLASVLFLDTRRPRLIQPARENIKRSLRFMKVAQSLDHFVVPVDDLVIAEEFYVRVFGGRITRRNGLNMRQRKRGAVPHTFIQIGGKRMGVYLQSEDRPQPTGARGLPTYSFTTTAQGLDAVTKDLSELGARFDGPVNNAYSFANQSLFMTDPTGNQY